MKKMKTKEIGSHDLYGVVGSLGGAKPYAKA